MCHLGTMLAALPEKRLEGDPDVIIEKIAYDSRQVSQGDLFVAIRGSQTDGHQFVDEAVARGAVAVVLEKERPVEGCIKVRVPDSRHALAILANEFYGHPSEEMKVVGITGTNGKTTISYLTKSVLEAAGWKVGLIGTIAYWVGDEVREAVITTPESLDLQRILKEMLRGGTDCVAVEVSSHSLVLDRVYGVDFDLGVFSNLSRDHLDFHSTLEEYFQAKSILFQRLTGRGAQAVINIDDPAGRRLMDLSRVPVVTYGFQHQAEVHPLSFDFSLEGTRLVATSPVGQIEFFFRLPGRFNIYNALATIGVGVAFGVHPAEMASGLEAVNSVKGRFERIDCGQDFTVLVDYSHTPGALENCLQAVRQLTPGKAIVVFGCGGDRDWGKRPLMGEVAARLSDYAVVTSDNPRGEDPVKIIEQIEAGIPIGFEYERTVDRAEAIRRALSLARSGDMVVIAGKGHENYQIIGDKKRPFDDREVAEQVLKSMLREVGGAEDARCSTLHDFR